MRDLKVLLSILLTEYKESVKRVNKGIAIPTSVESNKYGGLCYHVRNCDFNYKEVNKVDLFLNRYSRNRKMFFNWIGVKVDYPSFYWTPLNTKARINFLNREIAKL